MHRSPVAPTRLDVIPSSTAPSRWWRLLWVTVYVMVLSILLTCVALLVAVVIFMRDAPSMPHGPGLYVRDASSSGVVQSN
jgi:hypothetical protein